MTRPGQGAFGKVVCMNQYQLEHQRARRLALTDKFARVRKRHPAVERKIVDCAQDACVAGTEAMG
jgi:hypothetical protein